MNGKDDENAENEERKIGIGLHNDTDAIVAQYVCRRALLKGIPAKYYYVFLQPGQRFAEVNKYYKFFHLDTGGVYNPSNGYFDHHGIPKNHPKHGKCSALLMMEYAEEQLGPQPLHFWILAAFAQVTDKEKDKEAVGKYYDMLKQDPASAFILKGLPKVINLLGRTESSNMDILKYANKTIDIYLEQRKEPEKFMGWIANKFETGQIKVVTATKFNFPALVVERIPYDSGDFRNLLTFYHKAYPFVICSYEPTERRPWRRFGINKLVNAMNEKLLKKINLKKVYDALCEKYPDLKDNKDDLFLHNDGPFLYLNKIPEGFTFEKFVEMALNS